MSAQIDADLGRFEGEQSDDGGGDFRILQRWGLPLPPLDAVHSAEWRGVVALGALRNLREDGRP
ncbi:hypothetical protein [Streptomyces europaeiscabiei]|uniref:hypothetical protein n=2 Tax=Streptomyces TaxID=1883 RepID=UPI0029AA4BC2|nr:hypothetical protein [Streptomyces europaeiscabiei]MDX3588773.1 hypothetical protein [Streptomyces europaeiscabiei]MDX3612522.1 hypothetical protein [Streptomyces europaeiscabiei]WUD38037.1 hypothetical protein OG858_46020 [Streptomyces europaeiscabiei]